jgi:hypothetical protein
MMNAAALVLRKINPNVVVAAPTTTHGLIDLHV